MIKCIEKDNLNPICPHCCEALLEVWCRRLSSLLGRRYIYCCPHCLNVPGVSQRKGFWMG